MIDEIKELYSGIEKKTRFIIKAGNDLGKSPLTLRHHWFSQFWAIPTEHQQRIKELLKETLKEQEEKQTA